MNVIPGELKLLFIAWVSMMLGLLIGFHVNKTMGIVIGFVCVPIAGYAVVIGQIKFFKKLKAHRNESSSKQE